MVWGDGFCVVIVDFAFLVCVSLLQLLLCGFVWFGLVLVWVVVLF